MCLSKTVRTKQQKANNKHNTRTQIAVETNLQGIDTEVEVVPFATRKRLAHFETRKCLNEFVFQKRTDNRENELEVVRKQLGL